MDNKELISRAISFARDNLDNHDLSVQNIADAAGFSLDYFNRMFFAHTGFTVMAYVGYVRIKKAAMMLRDSQKSILEIALEVGYDSQEGFSKAFVRKYGKTPSEYRRQMQGKPVTYGELTDQSIAQRFLHDNPGLDPVDEKDVIDFLMEKDARKYGWICAEIKAMKLTMAAENGDSRRGVIGIGDDLRGGHYLELITDDRETLAAWLERFDCVTTIYTAIGHSKVMELLKMKNRMAELQNIAIFTGNTPESVLPGTLTLRKLTAGDRDSVVKWAGNRNDSYVRHLLTAAHYMDEHVLEYGIFDGDELIAVAGCGLDNVNGMVMNDCCIIRFAIGKEQDCLYKSIYNAVTNDLWRHGIVPYDTLQFGTYAMTHGGFSSTDVGYKIVNKRYRILN